MVQERDVRWRLTSYLRENRVNTIIQAHELARASKTCDIGLVTLVTQVCKGVQ